MSNVGAAPRDDLARRTLTGFLWVGGGKVAYAGLRLLVLVVLARLLTPADFGIVSAALVVVGFSAIFSQLGLAPAIVQRPDLEPRHIDAAFSASVAFGLSLGVLLWLTAPVTATLFRIEHVEPVLRALAWVFPIEGLAVIAEAQIQRDLRFRWLATVEIVTFALGYGMVGVTLALLGYGVWALVAAQMAKSVLYTTTLLVARPPRLRLRPDRHALGELLYYGAGFTTSKVANYLALQADNFVVGRWLGATALGFYGRAYEMMSAAPALVGEAVDRVLFPAMATVQRSHDRMAEGYRRGMGLIALVTLPLSAVLLVTAPEVVGAVLGPQWGPVVVPFQILALGMFLRTSYRIADVTARATGAVYRRAWRQLAYLACVVLGASIGRQWGIDGVATGVLIALAVNYGLMTHLGLGLVRLRWEDFWAAHLPPFRLALAVGGAAWGVSALLRPTALPPEVVLAAAVGLAVGVGLLVARSFPAAFLGNDGRWILVELRALALARGRAPAGWPETAAASRAGAAAYAPSLVQRLGQALAVEGVRYCQWKGHGHTARAATGEGDLDLLVDRADAERFSRVLSQLGFKLAQSAQPLRLSGLFHFYGFDPAVERPIHLHVHYRLVVGRPWTTTYALPIERAVLASATQNGVFRIPDPEFGLVLTAINLLERCEWRHTLVRPPAPLAAAFEEITALAAQTDPARLAATVGRHVPWLDARFLSACLAALRPEGSAWRRAALKRRLHRRLRAQAHRPPLSATLATWWHRAITFGGVLSSRSSRKQFASGGVIIALVGGDGAGKTTCAEALHRWLANDFDVMRAHLGRPPASLFILCVAATLRVASWLRLPPVTGYLELVYHLATARDRYRLYSRVRRFTATGGVAICERFPVPENRELVGPRIAALQHTVPFPRLAAWLARVEASYYQRILPQDLLLVLRVTPEVAARRKTTEPADYVLARARLVFNTDWSGTDAHVLDADRPLPEVLTDLKAVIWSAL